jgi:hypothetical protein
VNEAHAQDRRLLVIAERDAARGNAARPVQAAQRGTSRVNLSVRLGPMVRFEVQGESCAEIADALDGFERLNAIVDAMFSDLAERVYPGGEVPPDAAGEDLG